MAECVMFLRFTPARCVWYDHNIAMRILLAALAILAVFPIVRAQDTRVVTQPHVPPVCVTLTARHATEQNLDTARIQAAIDGCASGHAVELRASSASKTFLSGPLRLRPGVTLLVNSGVTLYASRNPRNYDLSPGSCGVVNKEHGTGCKPFILANHAPGSAIMGGGVIDGQGGQKLLGQKDSWWELAHLAQVTNQGQKCPRLVVVHRSNNFILYGITLRNAPNFHVLVENTDGFTAWGVKINTPATARNTDGIDPASSTNVSILHSYIHAGDDDVAIKAGDGGPSTHLTIADDHFYSGHGMSIGSETNGGVSDVLVSNLTLDGTTNGIRIKSDPSRGGLVEDVTYQNVCMRNVKHPILLTPAYTRAHGDLLPEYRNIMLRDVRVMTPGNYILRGLDAQHKLGVTLDNVFVAPPGRVDAAHAVITLGPEIGNFAPSGEDVALLKAANNEHGKPINCSGQFVPFPQ